MIILGYPGIGKTSLCKEYGSKEGFIDLESGWFSKSMFHWEDIYCKIAIELSKQGYVVFVSCHESVQKILEKYDGVVVAVYPGLELKEQWVEKLKTRYEEDPSGKNELAYLVVNANYDRHIGMLMNRNFYKYELYKMDYSLYDFVKNERRLWAE